MSIGALLIIKHLSIYQGTRNTGNTRDTSDTGDARGHKGDKETQGNIGNIRETRGHKGTQVTQEDTWDTGDTGCVLTYGARSPEMTKTWPWATENIVIPRINVDVDVTTDRATKAPKTFIKGDFERVEYEV